MIQCVIAKRWKLKSELHSIELLKVSVFKDLKKQANRKDKEVSKDKRERVNL